MYKSFRVKNFRCFKDLQINDLGRVNLIAGKNSTGKTALMEAMYVLTKHLKPEVLSAIQKGRDIAFPSDNLASYLQQYFYNYDATQRIVLESQLISPEQFANLCISLKQYNSQHLESFASYGTKLQDAGMSAADALETIVNSDVALEFLYRINDNKEDKEYSVVLLAHKGQPILAGQPWENQSVFITTQGRLDQEYAIKLFSGLDNNGKLPDLIEILSAFQIDLCDLRLSAPYGEMLIWGQVDELRIPLKLMGEGIVRFTHVIMTMLSSFPNTTFFIDEIENGIHHSVQCKVWQAIGKVARELDIQVFATTHSLEMIRAAYEAFSADDALDDFRYHRLDRKPGGNIEAVTYNKFGMEAVAAFDFQHEVRG